MSHDMLWCSMSRYKVVYVVMLFGMIWCVIILWYDIIWWCMMCDNVMIWYDMLSYVMTHEVMSFDVPWYVMIFYVMI